MTDYRERLTDEEQIILFNEFLDEIRKDKSKIYGGHQILEKVEDIALRLHFIDCPYCGRKK